MTSATADSTIAALRTKLATASQTILKLERDAVTAEGTIRELRAQLATAKAAAARPATPAALSSPAGPPVEILEAQMAEEKAKARAEGLDRELEAERRLRKEAQEELRQLQESAARLAHLAESPRAAPDPELSEQLRVARKETDRLSTALRQESERRCELQRRLDESMRAAQQSTQQDSTSSLERDSELAKLRRELQAHVGQGAEPDLRLQNYAFSGLKPFWTPELSLLKQDSYLFHKAWLENGRPCSGSVCTRIMFPPVRIIVENYVKKNGKMNLLRMTNC